MDAQFADSFADWRDIASVSVGETAQSRKNQTSGALILEPRPPVPERLGLL
jgi:hypothetical protein